MNYLDYIQNHYDEVVRIYEYRYCSTRDVAKVSLRNLSKKAKESVAIHQLNLPIYIPSNDLKLYVKTH